MKNPLNLKCKLLPGDIPSQSVFFSGSLQGRYSYVFAAESILVDARAKANKIINEAEKSILDARFEADKLIADASLEVASIKETAINNAVSESVVWLCDSINIEKKLSRKIISRWRDFTVNLLSELFSDVDVNKVMLEKLERKLEDLLGSGVVTLYVPEGIFVQASQQWCNIPELLIRADPNLIDGKAILDNGLVRIFIDLEEHFKNVLSQLSISLEGKSHG